MRAAWSVRPGSCAAISTHLGPWAATNERMIWSSSGVHVSRAALSSRPSAFDCLRAVRLAGRDPGLVHTWCFFGWPHLVHLYTWCVPVNVLFGTAVGGGITVGWPA